MEQSREVMGDASEQEEFDQKEVEDEDEDEDEVGEQSGEQEQDEEEEQQQEQEQVEQQEREQERSASSVDSLFNSPRPTNSPSPTDQVREPRESRKHASDQRENESSPTSDATLLPDQTPREDTSGSNNDAEHSVLALDSPGQPSMHRLPRHVDPNEVRANPWTRRAMQEFHHRFHPSNPSYKNKLRLDPSIESRIRHFILYPNSPLDPTIPLDARYKSRAKSYILSPFAPDGGLYRNDGATLRRHVASQDVWALLTAEHVRTGHKGRDRLMDVLKHAWVGYTLDEVMFVLASCRVCALSRKRIRGGKETRSLLDDAVAGEETRSLLGDAVADAVAQQQARGPPPPPPQPPLHQLPAAAQLARQPVLQRVIDGVPVPLDVVRPRPIRQRPPPPPPPVVPPHIQYPAPMGYATHVRNAYAPNKNGLVQYDVPDWYPC